MLATNYIESGGRQDPQSNMHRPAKLNDVLHIGDKSSHASHNLCKYRGLVYCSKCGAHGTSHFNLLAKQCGAPKEAGLRTLRCINKGWLPNGVSN